MTEDDDDDARRAEGIKRRNLDRLEDDGMMFFTILMAASISSGKSAKGAAETAEAGLAQLKSRFT